MTPRIPLQNASYSNPFQVVRPTLYPKPTFKDVDELIKNSILDPVLFAKNLLQVDLWSKQKEILYSIATNRKTAAKACHSSGKTFVAAVATLWWLARYEESLVITTAPTDRQVTELLWSEISALVKNSLYPFPKPLTSELEINSKRKAFGFTTSVDLGDEGTKFQGFHSKRILVIVDEGPGVVGKLWSSIEGLLASGDTRLLALGNPTISSGPFYDAFGINREGWNLFTISAFDTPNFEGVSYSYKDKNGQSRTVGKGKDLRSLTQEELGVSKIPYLISRHWVRDREREWGPGHPLWDSRVRGEFSSQSPDSLLSLEWLEQAKQRPTILTGKKLRAGIDVAGPGEDETTLVVMDGPSILLGKFWPQADPRGELVQDLRKLSTELGYTLPSFDSLSEIPPASANPKDFRNWIELIVDSCGIGYYLAQHLEDFGFVVSYVNVGVAANDKEHFTNLKAELYWGLRMRCKDGDLAGLTDETMIAQLSGIRYKLNSRGQIEIESKEGAVKRGVKSPDRAEGLVLAAAQSFQHGLFSLWEELAAESKKEVTVENLKQHPDNLTIPSSELSVAQKRDAGFGEFWSSLEDQVKLPGPIKQENVSLTTCPNCSGILSIYSEGAWRCNMCGIKGRGSEVLQ